MRQRLSVHRLGLFGARPRHFAGRFSIRGRAAVGTRDGRHPAEVGPALQTDPDASPHQFPAQPAADRRAGDHGRHHNQGENGRPPDDRVRGGSRQTGPGMHDCAGPEEYPAEGRYEEHETAYCRPVPSGLTKGRTPRPSIRPEQREFGKDAKGGATKYRRRHRGNNAPDGETGNEQDRPLDCGQPHAWLQSPTVARPTSKERPRRLRALTARPSIRVQRRHWAAMDSS